MTRNFPIECYINPARHSTSIIHQTLKYSSFCSQIIYSCVLYGSHNKQRLVTRIMASELSDLYSLPNIVRVVKSRRMRWAEHVVRMGEGRGLHRVLVGKPEGKRPLGRPRRRWEDNIQMDLQEVGGGCGDWMELAQDRDRWRALVSTVMNFRVR